MNQIEPKELKSLLDTGGVCLIDVRQPEEHDLVCIEGSKLIPLDELDSRVDEVRLLIESQKNVVLYCRSGKRSAMALEWLDAHGVKGNVKNLRGGINAYAKEVDPRLEPY